MEVHQEDHHPQEEDHHKAEEGFLVNQLNQAEVSSIDHHKDHQWQLQDHHNRDHLWPSKLSQDNQE